ncbi:uncharacterized protein LOC109051613 isoform X1 [Cyprinus carpio]|uniref:Uncharacterized protein LOC109051613 isoform X1 n=1 Tax=Cyprinus carpio TaxID=7962 RepID=A0A9Q9XGV6_CYPCA|nr:uncharacterized protein LOC109051613 isoform X1 [Cyprinus carpio]
MACKRNLSFTTPVSNRALQPAASPLSINDLMKQLISGQNALSRQLEGLMEKQAANTVLLEDAIQRLCALERKFDEQRLQEEQRPWEEPLHKRIKRAHNVGIAEAVRRLHNSENNPHKYDPQTGISLPRNQAVMTYQLEELKTTFADADPECIQACCKTYFETLRRKYNLSQPEKSQLRDAIKTGAKNRQRKRRVSVEIHQLVFKGIVHPKLKILLFSSDNHKRKYF